MEVLWRRMDPSTESVEQMVYPPPLSSPPPCPGGGGGRHLAHEQQEINRKPKAP